MGFDSCIRFEIGRGVILTVGSNPTFSAIFHQDHKQVASTRIKKLCDFLHKLGTSAFRSFPCKGQTLTTSLHLAFPSRILLDET